MIYQAFKRNFNPNTVIKFFKQRKINLRKRLPIYTRYYTAQADSTGLKLYIDVYRKDEELMKMLYK